MSAECRFQRWGKFRPIRDAAQSTACSSNAHLVLRLHNKFLRSVLLLLARSNRNTLLATMPTGMLRVQGEEVVDGSGERVILRGAGLGGWLK